MTAIPAEQLFIEVTLRFVKPSGYAVIVVPDGVVNYPGLKFIRFWRLRRARLVESVRLPKTTFATSKGINNPTVLIAQKLTLAEARQVDRECFGNLLQRIYEPPTHSRHILAYQADLSSP